jgi:hypothetical protein
MVEFEQSSFVVRKVCVGMLVRTHTKTSVQTTLLAPLEPHAPKTNQTQTPMKARENSHVIIKTAINKTQAMAYFTISNLERRNGCKMKTYQQYARMWYRNWIRLLCPCRWLQPLISEVLYDV